MNKVKWFVLGIIALSAGLLFGQAANAVVNPTAHIAMMSLAALGLWTAVLSAVSIILKFVIEIFGKHGTIWDFLLSASCLTSVVMLLISVIALVKGHEIQVPQSFVDMLVGTLILLLTLLHVRQPLQNAAQPPAGTGLPAGTNIPQS